MAPRCCTATCSGRGQIATSIKYVCFGASECARSEVQVERPAVRDSQGLGLCQPLRNKPLGLGSMTEGNRDPVRSEGLESDMVRAANASIVTCRAKGIVSEQEHSGAVRDVMK